MGANVFCMILCTLSCPGGNSAGIPILLFSSLLFFFLELEKDFEQSGFSQGKGAFTVCAVFIFFIRHSRRTDHKQKKNASCMCSLVLLLNSLWDKALKNLGLWDCLRFDYFPDQLSTLMYSLGTSSNFEGALKELCICCIFAWNTLNESAHWCLEHQWLNWCWICEKCLYLIPHVCGKRRTLNFGLSSFVLRSCSASNQKVEKGRHKDSQSYCTEILFIYYSYLVTCPLEICRRTHWVYHDQCPALTVYFETKYVVLHYDWN